MNDLLFALRSLRASPGFTLVVTATLGLGIGLNTAIFSLVDGVLLEPLPYEEPDRVMTLWESNTQLDVPQDQVSAGTYRDWVERAEGFDALGAYSFDSFVLGGTDQPEQIEGARISPSVLDVVGIQPELGRGFRADEAIDGNDRVVLLSNAFWTQRLGADPWWRVDQYPNTWNVWRREASRAGISGEDLTKLFEGDRTPLVELPGESSSSRDEATECSQVGACSKQCASQVASWERRVLERIDLVAPLSAFNEFLLEVGRKIGLTTLPSGVLCRVHAHAHVHLLGATAKDVARRNRSKAEGELLAAYAPCSRYAYWRWHFAGIDKLGKTLEARRRWCRERRMR